MGKVLSHPVAIIVFSLVAFNITTSLYRTQSRTRTSAERVPLLEQETAQIAREVSELERATSESQHSFVKERMARDELLLQKPGEYVVQMAVPEVVVPSPTPSPAPQPIEEWKEVLFR